MMILLTLACAAPQLSGTWMFTRLVTPDTGAECVTADVSHNFDGAYTPEPVETESEWSTDETVDYSPEVFFGRLEEDTSGMVLIVGDKTLIGTEKEKDSWDFSWTNETNGYGEQSHKSGYLFTHSYDTTSTLRVKGSFAEGSFKGSHTTESTATERWTESDSWSDAVSATIGTTGQLPSSGVLVRVDTEGNETPVSNDYQTFDCEDSDCTLSKVSSCIYTYVLTGEQTGFSPDDASWVKDAGQSAGNG